MGLYISNFYWTTILFNEDKKVFKANREMLD